MSSHLEPAGALPDHDHPPYSSLADAISDGREVVNITLSGQFVARRAEALKRAHCVVGAGFGLVAGEWPETFAAGAESVQPAQADELVEVLNEMHGAFAREQAAYATSAESVAADPQFDPATIMAIIQIVIDLISRFFKRKQ